jgi:choline dehydrogenase-like flavoprotein
VSVTAQFTARARGWKVFKRQYTARNGRRSSTYEAFLAGEPEQRSNLTVFTGAQVTRVLLEGDGARTTATGVEYRTAAGEITAVHAAKEVILSVVNSRLRVLGVERLSVADASVMPAVIIAGNPNAPTIMVDEKAV